MSAGGDLGVDAGGTKAAWVMLGADGAPLARGVAGGIQAAVLGAERTAAELAALLRLVEDETGIEVVSCVAGVAGAGRVAVRRAVRSAFAAAAGREVPCAVVGDPEAAAAAALAAGPGVAVWAGTGSFVVARDVGGRLWRAGGRGYVLDDRGGGYALVRAAAAAAVAAADAAGPPTALGEALCGHFAAERVVDLGAIAVESSPGELAAALPAVARVAAAGDAVAIAVFRQEANALAARVVGVAQRADLAPLPATLAIGGSVLLHCTAFRAAFAAAVAAHCGFAVELRAAADAALGAARLARALRRGETPLCTWTQDEHAA